jgi:ankyrin repeat protein
MFRTTRINTFETSQINRYNADLIYLISIDAYEEFLKTIDIKNINSVINNKNGYTALHYAIMFGKDRIIKYLIDNKCSIHTKTTDGSDAFDLCLKYNNKTLLNDYFEKNLANERELNKNITNQEKKINTLKDNNDYLTKSNEGFLEKNNSLNKELQNLKKDHNKLINEHKSLKTENSNNNDNIKSLKRKLIDYEIEIQNNEQVIKKLRLDLQKEVNEKNNYIRAYEGLCNNKK